MAQRVVSAIMRYCHFDGQRLRSTNTKMKHVLRPQNSLNGPPAYRRGLSNHEMHIARQKCRKELYMALNVPARSSVRPRVRPRPRPRACVSSFRDV